MVAAYTSRILNTNLAAAISNLVSAILPIIVVIPLLNKNTVHNNKLGIIMAIIGGILIAFFVMAINKAYVENKVAVVAPIVFGGSIFLSAILSFVFFKEKITTLQGLGLALLGVAILIITYARATGK